MRYFAQAFLLNSFVLSSVIAQPVTTPTQSHLKDLQQLWEQASESATIQRKLFDAAEEQSKQQAEMLVRTEKELTKREVQGNRFDRILDT